MVFHSDATLVVAGVRFMGESAKILSPEKRILIPTCEATCSLDLSCPVDEFSRFYNELLIDTLEITSNKRTEVDLILWNGACILHKEFKGEALAALRKENILKRPF